MVVEKMNELERIEQQEKALKEKKKKALSKEYEKLGRKFYKKSKVKSFENAVNMLEDMPIFSKREQSDNCSISEQDLATLKQFADELNWNEQGGYWRTDNIKNLTKFLATFRTENSDKF